MTTPDKTALSRARRSRTYDLRSDSSGLDAVEPDAQSDLMRTQPYDASTSAMQNETESSSFAQRGQHGEGAETIGNSVRGALSTGVTGATTTRGGQQGGIGDSAYDVDPEDDDTRFVDDPSYERDLTLGERFGGAMEQPGSDA